MKNVDKNSLVGEMLEIVESEYLLSSKGTISVVLRRKVVLNGL